MIQHQTYDELVTLVTEFRSEYRDLTDDELDKLTKKTFKINRATLREMDGVTDLLSVVGNNKT